MKKVATLMFLLFFLTSVGRTTPPRPGSTPMRDTDGLSRNRNYSELQGPIGTSTALLISLGAGAVAYKIKNNRKKEEE